MEFVIVVFRIGEDVRRIAASESRRQPLLHDIRTRTVNGGWCGVRPPRSAVSSRLFINQTLQPQLQPLQPTFHVLQLADQSHGVFAGEGLRPRLQHGNRAAHPLQLMKAVHRPEHTFA